MLYIGKKVARVDGQPVTLDVPATTYRGRTMVPLRFISESMGAQVNWEPAYNTVAISTAMAQSFTPSRPNRYSAKRPSNAAPSARHIADC